MCALALSDECINNSPSSADALTQVKTSQVLSEEDMIMLGDIKCDGGTQFASVLRNELLEAASEPMLSMMELRKEDIDPAGVTSLPMLVASVKYKNSSKVRLIMSELFELKGMICSLFIIIIIIINEHTNAVKIVYDHAVYVMG